MKYIIKETSEVKFFRFSPILMSRHFNEPELLERAEEYDITYPEEK